MLSFTCHKLHVQNDYFGRMQIKRFCVSVEITVCESDILFPNTGLFFQLILGKEYYLPQESLSLRPLIDR